MDNPWDKGDASGLVTYTDAQYWDQFKDGFEGATADDWNVDMSTYYGDGAYKILHNDLILN